MKIIFLTTITLICFSIGAIAQDQDQDQDQEVWGCQQVEGTGLFWESDRWVSKGLLPETVLLKIPTVPPRLLYGEVKESINGTYKRGDDREYGMFCRTNIGDSVSCLSGLGSEFFLLDQTTGKMGHASLFGALMGTDQRDTVTNRIYNCTKF